MTGRGADPVRLAMVAALVTLTGALAGCASKDASEPAPPAAPATTAATGGGSTTPATLVDYRRSGGFAGLEDHLVVMSDGRAVVEGRGPRREERLDAATMRDLVAALDRADLARLRPPDDPPVQGNDLTEHTITHRGHTVTVTDTAVPEQLRPLLSVLNRIVTEVRTP